jgi:hypothetical protein
MLEEIPISSSDVILCADVTALYPSIPLDFGITVVSEFCFERHLMPPDKLRFILSLMQWVLCNNYLTFDGQVYLQIKGTAMGTPMAPTFASLFLAALEIPILESLKYRIYQRYIDDIFAIMTHEVATRFITVFNKFCPSVQLEAVTIGKSGIFLDLDIALEDDSIVFKVFQKPGNIFQYIPPLSHHPRAVFKSWIREEIFRYRLRSSRDKDFFEICAAFIDRLHSRGYSSCYTARVLVNLPTRATLMDRVSHPNYSSSFDANPTPSAYPNRILRSGPVLVLPQANVSPNPNWRGYLLLPPSVTEHPEYTKLHGERNIFIRYSHTNNIASHLLRSLFE